MTTCGRLYRESTKPSLGHFLHFLAWASMIFFSKIFWSIFQDFGGFFSLYGMDMKTPFHFDDPRILPISEVWKLMTPLDCIRNRSLVGNKNHICPTNRAEYMNFNATNALWYSKIAKKCFQNHVVLSRYRRPYVGVFSFIFLHYFWSFLTSGDCLGFVPSLQIFRALLRLKARAARVSHETVGIFWGTVMCCGLFCGCGNSLWGIFGVR